jgi:hypothetical protein
VLWVPHLIRALWWWFVMTETAQIDHRTLWWIARR